MKYYAIFLCVMSVIAFILYGVDKAKAKKKQWRIPEKVLLGFSALGGAFGGGLAMLLFRHKTKHWYFVVINIVSLIVQLGLLAYLLYRTFLL